MVYHRLVMILLGVTLALAACMPADSPLPTLDPRALKPTHTRLIPTRTPRVTETLVLAPTLTHTPLPTVTPTLTATPLPTHTLTPLPSNTESPTPTLTLTPIPPCREPNGYMVAEKMYSTILQTQVAMRVYLPPCYNDTTRRLPTLYLAHGMFQDESAWTDVGAPLTAANMIADKQLPPFILVMPSEKELSTPFGYVLANELVPYIDQHYRTITDRRYRALGGLSRGASWAMFTVLRYPGIFGKMGMHSIGEFGQEEFKTWLQSVPNGLLPQIYIDIGDQDFSRSGSEWLDRTLTELRVPHQFRINKGTHERAYWAANVKDYLRWYTAGWETN